MVIGFFLIQPSKKFERWLVTGVQLIEKDADAPDFYSFSWSSISGATRDKTRERMGKLPTQLPNPHPRNIRILSIKFSYRAARGSSHVGKTFKQAVTSEKKSLQSSLSIRQQ